MADLTVASIKGLALDTPKEKKTEAQLAIEALEAKLKAEQDNHAWTKETFRRQTDEAEKRCCAQRVCSRC